MIEAIRSWVLKILSFLLPTLFRKIYTHEKLVKLIEVSVSSENDGIVVNCADLPDARAWIEVTNLSPLSLKLVGIEAILYWVGRAAEFKSLQRIVIKPHSKERIVIEASLNGRQSEHIKAKNSMDMPRLHVSAYFESTIREINKQRDIETSNVRLLNCDSA
ncbi:MAG: hypothetical protein KZQ91_07635 [Candidatus Thiodiazotropha sp. (ex Lucinoma borealis)]|nr:hypothetical protein [Candidatus Thiodiazotropha sp. (ex Lucinoma borealis)]